MLHKCALFFESFTTGLARKLIHKDLLHLSFFLELAILFSEVLSVFAEALCFELPLVLFSLLNLAFLGFLNSGLFCDELLVAMVLLLEEVNEFSHFVVVL